MQTNKTNIATREMIQSGKYSYKEMCDKKNPLHICIDTFYLWKNRDFTHDDFPGRHKNGYKKQLTDEQEQEIIAKRREIIKCPVTVFYRVHVKEKYPCSLKVIYKLFHKHDLMKEKKEKEPCGTFGDKKEGFLHIDVTYLPKLEGKKTYLYVAIDRKTRYAFWKVYDRKTLSNTIDFAECCKEKFPFPIYHILTDNGKEFSKRFSEKWCKENEIEYSHTRPYTPKTNGMVERLNGTIKSECVRAQHFKNIDEMERQLAWYLDFYNTRRYHSSLRCTPLRYIIKSGLLQKN